MMECSSAMKRNDLLIYATTWVNLKYMYFTKGKKARPKNPDPTYCKIPLM